MANMKFGQHIVTFVDTEDPCYELSISTKDTDVCLRIGDHEAFLMCAAAAEELANTLMDMVRSVKGGR
jgi:hypothetical protein